MDEIILPAAQVPAGADEERPHGPLTAFSYHYSSHGMMAGSGSFGGDRVEWKPDGSVVLTSSSTGGGKHVENQYSVTPEAAEQLKAYVEDNHLAALAEKKIETPVMYDCFTSTSISMSFDSSGIGGSRCDTRTIQCGPAHMSFATIEDAISALLKQCRDTGMFLSGSMHETEGLPGMFPISGMMDGPYSRPKKTEPVPAGPKWICSCGFSDNTGKFCMECGNPKPSVAEAGRWTCPNCGTSGNGGKFCAECGTPRPQ